MFCIALVLFHSMIITPAHYYIIHYYVILHFCYYTIDLLLNFHNYLL